MSGFVYLNFYVNAPLSLSKSIHICLVTTHCASAASSSKSARLVIVWCLLFLLARTECDLRYRVPIKELFVPVNVTAQHRAYGF